MMMMTDAVFILPLIQSIKIEKLVLLLAESILEPLHDGQHLLLFQTTADNLYSNRQAVHRFGIILLVRSLGNAVQLLQVEWRRQPVQLLVDVGDGHNSRRVVQLPR